MDDMLTCFRCESGINPQVWAFRLTEWWTPHISTLRRGSLDRKSFFFCGMKCFFFVLVLLAMEEARLATPEAMFFYYYYFFFSKHARKLVMPAWLTGSGSVLNGRTVKTSTPEAAVSQNASHRMLPSTCNSSFPPVFPLSSLRSIRRNKINNNVKYRR